MEKNISNLLNKLKSQKNLNIILFALASFMFAIPSIIYYMQNKTISKFVLYYKFLLSDSILRSTQTIAYIALLTIITALYILIIKKRKMIFQNSKKLFIFIAIISIIFIAVIPFSSSDIFYYLGIGRLDSKYHQNPYYTTIAEFVENDDNNKYLSEDTVLKEGYINPWSDTTVVYGPVWTLICKIIAGASFGNVDIGLLLFKMVNAIIHLLNCYLIYKISKKKIFTLIYGINPLVLIEGIACVHNDIFMVLFILLSMYFVQKRKNLKLSIVSLAIATSIKYFAIILLPFIIIYHFREEKPSKRFIKCIQYGIMFLVIVAIPYLLYVRDLQVFSGLFTQQEKVAKSFYLFINEYFYDMPGLTLSKLNKFLLCAFTIIYFFTCVTLLNKKEIKFRQEMQKANYFIMAFLFLLITNFQLWYIMWLFPCLIWQKANIIRLIMQISLVSQFANSIFLTYGEGWIYGMPFVFIFVVGTLVIYIMDSSQKRRNFIKRYNERKSIK